MTVIGSGRASAGVGATVRRIRDALAAAGVTEAPTGADGAALVIVDPAAWYAEQPVPPSGASLGRAIAVSLAPYGTPTMQDDAQVARLFGAVAHPQARSAEHLARLGCRAHHVALGCRATAANAERPLDVLSFGPSTPRRLRALARGAAVLDDVRHAHRFDEELPAENGDAHPLAVARVLVDIAADDDASVDPALWIDAFEAGTAVVTERLGALPGELEQTLVRAPLETVFARARALAADPDRAAALAAAGHAALVAVAPLDAMGHALGELLEQAAGAAPPRAGHRPQLSHHAAPAERLSVRELLQREQRKADANVREGLRIVLSDVRRLERRLARIEGDGVPDETAVVHTPAPAPAVKVSVLIPAYKASRMLAGALESVQATAAEDGAPALEVVLVDDGSPQDDAATAAQWAGAHPQLAVTVLRHRFNRGLATARNTALEHARGELVLPLDADNALRPGGLQRLLGALQDDPQAAFAYGLLHERDAGGPVGLRGLYPWEPERLRWGNYIDALALIRRDPLRELGGYAVDMPEQGYEDWDLWCRFAEHGLTGAWVPQLVASYQIRADSMSAALHLSHIGPLADMVARHPALLG